MIPPLKEAIRLSLEEIRSLRTPRTLEDFECSTGLDREEALKLIRPQKETFYTYALLHPKTSLPFYVGKGKGGRIFDHEWKAKRLTTNSHKFNIIRKIQREGGKIRYFATIKDDKVEAKMILNDLLEEKDFIKA